MTDLEIIDNWNGSTPEEENLQLEIQRKFSESVDTANYALDSEKTKIAKDYIKYIHQQRRLLEKRKKEREDRYA